MRLIIIYQYTNGDAGMYNNNNNIVHNQALLRICVTLGLYNIMEGLLHVIVLVSLIVYLRLQFVPTTVQHALTH